MKKNNILLFITAFFWGSSFVFQRIATTYVDAFTFTLYRSLIAFILFLLIILCSKNKMKLIKVEKKILVYVILSGVILFCAYFIQQIALNYTKASKTGFLTSTQIIIVPLLVIFLKEKVQLKTWICALVSLVGFYIMSKTESLLPSVGDSLILVTAIFFSIQVILCKKIGDKINPFLYGFLVNLVICVLSLISVFIYKTESTDIKDFIWPLLYVSFFASFLGSIFQLLGQKNLDEAKASLILSMQAIFGLIVSILILNESMNIQEIIGSLIVFISIIISQVNFKFNRKVV